MQYETTLKFRGFEDQDFACFDTDLFSDGSSPLIAKLAVDNETAYAILDSEGLTVMVVDIENGLLMGWKDRWSWPSSEALTVMWSLKEEMTKEELNK